MLSVRDSHLDTRRAPAFAADHARLAPSTRLCFVADGRSPIARNWIADYAARGFEVHLATTYPCDATALGVASLTTVPAALGRLAGRGSSQPVGALDARAGVHRPSISRRARARLTAALLPTALGWVAPLDLTPHARRLRQYIDEVDPDLVHAMRVPYEGILAALALEGTHRPLVTSVWGNDFELWAARYPLVGRLTRRALARTTALHPDCARDLRLARAWGWDASRPAAVIPGNGGVRTERFHPGAADPALRARYDLPPDAPIVLNARGFRGYVRNDTFFRAIPRVLTFRPDAVFVGIGMRDHPLAERWTRELGVRHAVRLLPAVSPADMAELFRLATVAVSPAEFDGTPNTLLEAMACGAFPVAGDIASVREWIVDQENGLLCDPADVGALGDALGRALGDSSLRARAATRNRVLIAERATFREGMRRADALYVAALAAVQTPAVA